MSCNLCCEFATGRTKWIGIKIWIKVEIVSWDGIKNWNINYSQRMELEIRIKIGIFCEMEIENWNEIIGKKWN